MRRVKREQSSKAAISVLVSCMGAICWIDDASAQIATDGTVGAAGPVTPSAGVYEIPQALGATSGANLFHSFSEFSVPFGTEVMFSGAADLTNIISRVTGGSETEIAGLLSVVGPTEANFFLINPAGVVFVDGASLDVSGRVYISTASGVRFADQSSFTVTTPSGSTLTMASPESFGFIGGEANVSFSDVSFLGGAPSLFVAAPDIAVENSVIDASTLDLIATGPAAQNLEIEGQLDAVALAGTLFISNSSLRTNTFFGDSGALRLAGGSIELSASTVQSSTTDLSGGDFQVVTTTLLMVDSDLGTITDGIGDAGDVSINAEEIRLDFASIISDTGVSASGDSGDIAVQADSISVLNASIFETATFGAGNAGSMSIDTTVLAIDGSVVGSEVGIGASGNAGDVTIGAEQIDVLSFGFLGSSTFGSGDAGNVLVNVSYLNVDSGAVAAETQSTGDGGTVEVNAVDIVVQNSGALGAASFGAGNAGNLIVFADTIAVLNAPNSPTFSSVGVDALGSGNGGTVSLTTRDLRVEGHSIVTAATIGAGDAGSVDIQADSITVRDQGSILSSTAGSGDGGSLSINAASLTIERGFVSAEVFPGAAGNGGNIALDVDRIRISDFGSIIAKTTGVGDAGDIELIVGELTLDGGFVSAEAGTGALGSGGNVNISANAIVVQNGGAITTASTNVNAAGSISIVAQEIEIAGAGAQISSQNDSSGPAGEISIGASVLAVADGATISSNSTSGPAGNLELFFPADGLLIIGGEAPGVITTSSGSDSGGRITISNPLAIIANGSRILALGEVGGANVQIQSRYWIQSTDRENLLSVNGLLLVETQVSDPAESAATLETDFLGASEVLASQCAAQRSGTASVLSYGGLNAPAILSLSPLSAPAFYSSLITRPGTTAGHGAVFELACARVSTRW
jgi:filamentous hemagglutinin family protein